MGVDDGSVGMVSDREGLNWDCGSGGKGNIVHFDQSVPAAVKQDSKKTASVSQRLNHSL